MQSLPISPSIIISTIDHDEKGKGRKEGRKEGGKETMQPAGIQHVSCHPLHWPSSHDEKQQPQQREKQQQQQQQQQHFPKHRIDHRGTCPFRDPTDPNPCIRSASSSITTKGTTLSKEKYFSHPFHRHLQLPYLHTHPHHHPHTCPISQQAHTDVSHRIDIPISTNKRAVDEDPTPNEE